MQKLNWIINAKHGWTTEQEMNYEHWLDNHSLYEIKGSVG